MIDKKQCACCGFLTLQTDSLFEICPVCFWQNDLVQSDNPDYEGGANEVSLNQAKINYNKFGAIEYKYISLVRNPNEKELLR